MAESLSFQQMTTRLMARENIINNQRRKNFKSYTHETVYKLQKKVSKEARAWKSCMIQRNVTIHF